MYEWVRLVGILLTERHQPILYFNLNLGNSKRSKARTVEIFEEK
jgi:hypothetical protein